LQARVDAIGGVGPETLVGLQDRVDLTLSQVEAKVTKRGQCLEGTAQELRAQLLVREQPANDKLRGFLRHEKSIAIVDGKGDATATLDHSEKTRGEGRGAQNVGGSRVRLDTHLVYPCAAPFGDSPNRRAERRMHDGMSNDSGVRRQRGANRAG